MAVLSVKLSNSIHSAIKNFAADDGIELDGGQFADDVRLNLAKAGLGAEAASVKMVHRMGGEVVSVDDAVKAAKEMV